MTPKTEELIQMIERLPRPEKDHVIEALLKLMEGEEEVQDLEELRSQYPGEWLAIVIPEGEDRYDPKRGRLIAHSPDRTVVWREVARLPENEDVYVFFNGPVAVKGFEVFFYDTKDTPEIAKLGG